MLMLSLHIFAASAAAIDAAQRNIYDLNILYFNIKEDAGCGAGGGGGPGACVGLQGTEPAEQAFNFLKGKGLSPMAAAAVVGNLMLESNLDPNATNPSSGAHGIAQWLGTRLTNLNNFASTQTPSDPNAFCVQLDFLWYEITEGTEKSMDVLGALKDAEAAGGTPESLAGVWEAKFERSGGAGLAQRAQNAKDIYDQFASGGAITGGGTASAAAGGGNCGGTGVVAGNIIQTAIGLAWPEPFNKANPPETGRTGPLTPKPEYSAAMQQYNPGQRADGADCGVFVATVLRAAGVDPNYPGVGTAVQMPYLQAHPEKYQPVTDLATIQPGDILIRTGSPFGHTYIYLGDQGPGGYNAASASLDDHSGNLGNEITPGFSAFRVIQ